MNINLNKWVTWLIVALIIFAICWLAKIGGFLEGRGQINSAQVSLGGDVGITRGQ